MLASFCQGMAQAWLDDESQMRIANGPGGKRTLAKSWRATATVQSGRSVVGMGEDRRKL